MYCVCKCVCVCVCVCVFYPTAVNEGIYVHVPDCVCMHVSGCSVHLCVCMCVCVCVCVCVSLCVGPGVAGRHMNIESVRQAVTEWLASTHTCTQSLLKASA